ncbi:hypothetical protein M5D96_012877, partial [Drosophila gunungcola]
SEERGKLRTYKKKKVGTKKKIEREREEEILRICQQLCVVTKATKIRARERGMAVTNAQEKTQVCSLALQRHKQKHIPIPNWTRPGEE